MKRIASKLGISLMAAGLAAAPAWAQCPGVDDGFEDNDTCLTAVPMANGTYTGLYVEKLDSDFYVLTAPPGMYVVAKARFTHAQRSDGGGTNPASTNPPLYYLYLVPAYELASGGDLFAQVSAMRLASVPSRR